MQRLEEFKSNHSLSKNRVKKFLEDSENDIRFLDYNKELIANISKETYLVDRFVANGKGVVKDTKTGLEWIAGPDKDTTWHEAKSWAENLATDGGNWRIPTRQELKTLYKKSFGTRNMSPLLTTTGWYVWSGEIESHEKGWSRAWYFDFNSGIYDYCTSSDPYGRRSFAVRSQRY